MVHVEHCDVHKSNPFPNSSVSCGLPRIVRASRCCSLAFDLFVAMLRLQAAVQHYDWGRIGQESEVARLYALSTGNEIEMDQPYAELWMGTHPSGPSLITVDIDESSSQERQHGILLSEWLQEHPEALGEKVLRKWHGELPFLFKVLSIAKALSIQAHPDKQLAERLYQTQPKIYKDPNHKPEMALALTNFEALCGFISPEEVKEVLGAVPELQQVLKDSEVVQLLYESSGQSCDSVQAAKAALQRAFTTLMTLDKDKVIVTLRALTVRLTKEKEFKMLSPREELVLVLEKQYPADVGVLASLFLNHVRLRPGEAVFLAANVPHAYISGECVECMATSDNVVRAGLTPKFRDVRTLSSMLTYEQGFPDISDGYPVSLFTKRYSSPFEEFEVDMITIPVGESLQLSPISGPSIFLVFEGRGTAVFSDGECRPSGVTKGLIFFVPAGKEFKLSSSEPQPDVNGNKTANGCGSRREESFPSGDTPLRLYRAGVNSTVLK